MDAWVWVVIVIAVLAVIGIVMWSSMRRRRSQRLRERFGPEYERATTEAGARRRGESELAAREKRRDRLEIRELDRAARERYAVAWHETQVRFVDAPAEAVVQADALVTDVMRDRGYPMENFEQRSADVSVDHPEVVQNYRAAHGISMASEQGHASTEDLRQAMVHYRALFLELIGPSTAASEPPVPEGVVDLNEPAEVDERRR